MANSSPRVAFLIHIHLARDQVSFGHSTHLYTAFKPPLHSRLIHLQTKMDAQIGREQQAKEFDDVKARKSGFLDNFMPHILNMYGSRATASDFEMYAPNATFEDPLMCAHGVKEIKSAFYSLPKLFSESRIVEYSIQENTTAPGKHEILIDNKQFYKIFGKEINMVSLIKLDIEDGKVVRHQDWWDKKPLMNRETVKLPLVGRFVEMSRRGSMFLTHAWMGFGKDPKP